MVIFEVFVGCDLEEVVVFHWHPCRVVYCLDRIKYVGMGGYFSIHMLVVNDTRKSTPSIPTVVGGLVVGVKVPQSRIRMKWNGEEVLMVGASGLMRGWNRQKLGGVIGGPWGALRSFSVIGYWMLCSEGICNFGVEL